jgi:murein DD-endopeptidase MepM/ murein hydrolase activator NlpD
MSGRLIAILLLVVAIALFGWWFVTRCNSKWPCAVEQHAEATTTTAPAAAAPAAETPAAEPAAAPETTAPATEAPAAEPPAAATPAAPAASEPAASASDILKDANGTPFTYDPPGQLVASSGSGVTSDTIYAPGMRFPTEVSPAFPNSQVYGHGGGSGPGGGQCDPENYSYPWRDDFCETRSWDSPVCPSGKGHQGQDIRPATCKKATHWAVAAEAGQITGIGTYTVTLTADSGIRVRYLHMAMDKLAVAVGDRVTRGQRIGLVSNDFGGSATTIHLHFEIKTTVLLPDGTSQIHFAPPYSSLVESYKRLLKGTP